jgi:hypothetical protein
MLNYQRVGTNKQNGTLNKQQMGAENTKLGLQQQRNMGIEAIEIGTKNRSLTHNHWHCTNRILNLYM